MRRYPASFPARRKSTARRAHLKQLRGGLAESETDGAWLAGEAVRLQASLDASLLSRSELLDAITCGQGPGWGFRVGCD